MVAASGDLGEVASESSTEPQLSSVMNKGTSIPRRMHIPNMAFSNLYVYLKILYLIFLLTFLSILIYISEGIFTVLSFILKTKTTEVFSMPYKFSVFPK